jgi:hypothetical protein
LKEARNAIAKVYVSNNSFSSISAQSPWPHNNIIILLVFSVGRYLRTINLRRQTSYSHYSRLDIFFNVECLFFAKNHHNWNALLAVAKIHCLFHKMHQVDKGPFIKTDNHLWFSRIWYQALVVRSVFEYQKRRSFQ